MIGVDSKKQVCLNEKCPDFGRKDAGHITKKGFNAKGQPDVCVQDLWSKISRD